jgi:hypothetical protein
MSKDKNPQRLEYHYTAKELAAAICVEALIAVLRDDEYWLGDASANYRRRALDQIEKLAMLLGDKYNFDFMLPERNYRDE